MTESTSSETTPLHPLEVAAAETPHLREPGDDTPPGAFDAFQGSTETEVARWAAEVRPAFGKNRVQFSYAICDALATAGITPTAASVLRVGKWGHHTSVGSDVSRWLSKLTQRFVELQAGVPLPARRLANDLIEKLFTLSRNEAESSVLQRLAPLEERIAELTVALAEQQDKVQHIKSEWRAIAAQYERQLETSEAARASADLSHKAAMEHAEKLVAANDRLSLELVNEKEASRLDAEASAKMQAALQQTLLTTQTAAAESLNQARIEHDGERKRLMLQLDDQRTAERQAAAAHRAEMTALTNKLEALRQQHEKTTVALTRESALHEGAKDRWQTTVQQLEREKVQLAASESLQASVLVLAMIHRRLGLQITRDADKDTAALLVRDLNMTPTMADKFVQNIPVGELNHEKQANPST